jgi:hypothetical protein
LSPEQAAAQRGTSSEPAPREPPRSQSPACNSSDDDELSQTTSCLGHVRQNKAWVKRLAASALALRAPSERHPTPVSSDTEDHEEMTEDQKRCARTGKKLAAAASPKAPAVKPVQEAKASKSLVKGQESPETKVSKPMATRSQASRAGSLRPGGGSGQTDTCVAQGNLSKT